MRLETMVAMANFEIPAEFLRRYISSAIDVVIQLARLTDGSRKLLSVQEITGMEGSTITMQEIFKFQREGIGEGGKVLGGFTATGIRSHYAERFKVWGFDLPNDIYKPTRRLSS
jgi:pilus assembly protein CpaF